MTCQLLTPSPLGETTGDLEISYSHALIIGGTGMLLEASSVIARSAVRSTFVASSLSSESRLTQRLGDSNSWQLLLLDWKRPETFLDGMESHLRSLPPIDLVLSWFHDPGLAPQTAARLQAQPLCKFVHVIGSASRNPVEIAIGSAVKFKHLPQFDYRQVLLGYERDRGNPRWLTNSEICSGALTAISASSKRVIVGDIRDWEHRP